MYEEWAYITPDTFFMYQMVVVPCGMVLGMLLGYFLRWWYIEYMMRKAHTNAKAWEKLKDMLQKHGYVIASITDND
jgi:membrane protein DedA with SNARE-associated domain